MRIAILCISPPFGKSPDAVYAEKLRGAAEDKGHVAEVFRIPMPNSRGTRPLEAAFTASLGDFGCYDMLITLGFPACCAKHERKICLMTAECSAAETHALRPALKGAEVLAGSEDIREWLRAADISSAELSADFVNDILKRCE